MLLLRLYQRRVAEVGRRLEMRTRQAHHFLEIELSGICFAPPAEIDSVKAGADTSPPEDES